MFTQSYTEQASSYTEDISPLWFSVCTPCTPCNLSRHPLKTVDFIRERGTPYPLTSVAFRQMILTSRSITAVYTHTHILPRQQGTVISVSPENRTEGVGQGFKTFLADTLGVGQDFKTFLTDTLGGRAGLQNILIHRNRCFVRISNS